MSAETRELMDLVSVGPETLKDFHALGIRTVAELVSADAGQLFEELCRLRGERIDRCCEDVFSAAIAQARDPALPAEKRQWWYWSRVRKARKP